LFLRRSFVLQFYPGAEVERRHFAGRIEHVASRQTARFDSLEEISALTRWVPVMVRAPPR
jgi:hypothetical protein